MTIKFAYIRDIYEPARVLTIAREFRDGYLFVGWAVCHPNDQFIKREGRERAIEKMDGAFPASHLGGDYNSRTYVASIEHIARHAPDSDRAKYIANAWLGDYYLLNRKR